jgi:Ras-related GTP-binding protein C/D
MEKVFLFEIVSKLFIATDSTPVDIDSFAICSEMIDVFLDISYIYGSQKHIYDSKNQRQSVIKLSDGTILLLKEVEQYLALICIIKDQHYDRPYLIDYNIDVFK